MPRRRITSVTTPKKPSKEPSLPSQDESRRANVLREEMLSQFRMLGESLSAVREDVNSMKPELHAIKEDVAILKSAVRSQGADLRAIKSDVTTIKSDVATLKSNVSEIKGDIKGYNQRLEVVEAKLAS
jgi:chromosome segregation ATPase